jgi:hypothetical protein
VGADDATSGISNMLAQGQGDTPPGGPSATPPRQPLNKDDLRAQIVLLDFGLAEELTPDVRQRFISFLNCIPAGGWVEGSHMYWHLPAGGTNSSALPDHGHLWFCETSCATANAMGSKPTRVPCCSWWAGKGRQAAEHLLSWGEPQRCPRPGAFILACEGLFKHHCDISAPQVGEGGAAHLQGSALPYPLSGFMYSHSHGCKVPSN